jgi:hypothetical protein
MALFLETPRKDAKRKRDYIMKQGYSITILRTPPDIKILKTTKCPLCGIKVAYYTDGKEKTHRCTNCEGYCTF